MGKIIQLDEKVFKKIAAGEVVERPLSVVKELVENAIDAGADRIVVELTEAGKGSIKVTDNGEGFSPDDITQAFQRHSTSKFRKLEDFDTLQTLGFRGEALPSILEVSIIELKTASDDSGHGIHTRFEGSDIISQTDIPFNRGSEIEVKELFYNFPVRKKFLKSDRTELNQIVSFLEQAALICHETTFILSNNGRTVFSYQKAGSFQDRIYQIFGKDFLDRLTPVTYSNNGYQAKGFVSKVSSGSSSKKRQFFFINGRIVREKTLIAAFNNSFSRFLDKGRFPEGVLDISVPPHDIDVNIHPMKLEIKFRDSSQIYNFIKTLVRRSLDDSVLSEPELTMENESKPIDLSARFKFESSGSEIQKNPSEFTQPALFEPDQLESDPFKLIGQYKNSYILIEKDDELILVDQHNGHERKNFDRLKSAYEQQAVESVTPLFPIIVELSATEQALLNEKLDLFKRLGFDIRDYSSRSVDIKSFPAILHEREIREVFTSILHLKSDETDFEDKVFAQVACKSAIKINHPLQAEEMKKIVRDLFASSNPYYCPHGRPIIIKYSLEEIEKQLKRR